MTPAWVHLVDLSLAAAIAAGGGYSMFRLFASTEQARRAQMTEFVKILTDQMVKRQDDQALAINALRDAVLLLRDEIRNSRAEGRLSAIAYCRVMQLSAAEEITETGRWEERRAVLGMGDWFAEEFLLEQEAAAASDICRASPECPKSA